jgi:two-component system LytT family sensor kinase
MRALGGTVPFPRSRRSTAEWHAAWLASVVAGGALFLVEGLVQRGGATHRLSSLVSFGLEIVPWYATIVLLPLIFALSVRYPIAGARAGRAWLVHLPTGLALCALHLLLCVLAIAWLRDWSGRGISWLSGARSTFEARWLSELVIYGLLVAACHVVLFTRSLRQRELAESTLRARLAESELKWLRAQLEPHFLFNTLNAIAAYLREDPDVAERMLERLGELLQAVFRTTGDSELPLDQELQLVQHYLDIHRVRFGRLLRSELEVAAGTDGALVPALLLQPIVENAIRHGIGSRAGDACIAIRACRRDGMLELCVEDDGPLTVLAPAGEAAREGVGLSNTRQRLAQLYGSRQSLEIRRGAQRGTTVTIALPFHIAPSPPAGERPVGAPVND